MTIEPVVQLVELSAEDYRSAERRPLTSLLVSSPSFDVPWPADPDYDLYDVQPAVIATSGYDENAGGFSLPGLRLGLFVIAEIDLTQQSSPARTVHLSLTSFVHQLAGGGFREINDFPDLLTDAHVSWGDGSNSVFDVSSPGGGAQHTYSSAGTYDVRLELRFAEAENFAWSNYPAATSRITVS